MARTLADLRASDEAHLIHPLFNPATHRAQGPIVMVRGRGIFLEDSEGKRYIDGLSGLWNVNCGHGRVEPFVGSVPIPGTGGAVRVHPAILADLGPGNSWLLPPGAPPGPERVQMQKPPAPCLSREPGVATLATEWALWGSNPRPTD